MNRAEKMLDRVSKMLATADHPGTPAAEAETFLEAAQKLAAQNGIDLAVARMHQAKRERAEEPEERRIQINPYSRKQNRKHFMELAMHIADVNDVEYLIGGKEYTLHAVGFPSDLNVVEALYVHLAVQMVSQCNAALKAGANREIQRVPKQTWEDIPEEEQEWGEWTSRDGGYYYNDSPSYPNSSGYDAPTRRLVPVLDEDGEPIIEERSVALTDGRVFRHEFYAAFTARMAARLWGAKRAEEKRQGVEAEGSNETSLAIRDKKAEVRKASEEQRAKVRHLGTYQSSSEGRSSYDPTGAGRESGRRAAENANLDQTQTLGGARKELA